MKNIFLLLSLLLAGCFNNDQQRNIVHQTAFTPPAKTICNYSVKKANCRNLYLKNDVSGINLARFIADSLIDCWYGTAWDFNGTTSIPQQGTIACGYFVTTVLRDAGMKLNRVKLAQCASSELIRSCCSGINIYRDKTIGNFVAAVKVRGIGLYIAGLDYHVGFIYNDGEEVYFIHASFYRPACVVKEKALASPVLKNSRLRMLGKINFNH